MLTRPDLEKTWPNAKLLRIDAAVAAQLDLPANTREFLANIGVPEEANGIEFSFASARVIEQSYAGPQIPAGIPEIRRTFYQIGSFNKAFWVCLERSSGRVILLPDAGWRDNGFVNSSIEQFLLCAIWYERCHAKLPKEDSGTAPDECIQLLVEGISRIDPTALTTQDEAWWPLWVRRWRGEY